MFFVAKLIKGTTMRYAVLAGCVLFLVLIVGTYAFFFRTSHESDPYTKFMLEAYDDIQQNYWIKPGMYTQFNTPELSQLFALAVQKEGYPATLSTSTRSGVAEMLESAVDSATSTTAKQQLAAQTVGLVLYNLQPIGRDSLYSQQQVTALQQEVSNINPNNNLYQDLSIATGSSVSTVNQAYAQKAAQLAASTTSTAKAELQAIAYAHEVLSNPSDKQLYDTTQIEPSVLPHIIGQTLYLDVDKIAPTTLGEFARAVDAASTTPGLTSMIIDLRDNIGGDLAFTQAFVGLFIGNNQYAFDLYRQGEDQVQRTTEPEFSELNRYTNIAVLTDGLTQSTAELTTAALKRLRLAYVVGTKTRGWGSVEATYPLTTVIDPSTSYTLLLVNALTLRDDQQFIEQHGVVPDVDVSASGWQKELPMYFTSSSIIAAIEKVIPEGPLH